MTRIGQLGVALLVIAHMGAALAQESVRQLPPEAASGWVGQVVTVCGQALDLACHGQARSAILTFVTPSASPSITVGAAPGAQVEIDARASLRPQSVCVTGRVARTHVGHEVQITRPDQIVFNTPAKPVDDVGERPRRSCETGVVAPKLLRNVPVQYTPDAMRRKISGRVMMQGIVDTSGLVRDVYVIRSLDPGGLDVKAVEAFAQFEFVPGLADGQRVPMVIAFDMAFSTREF